MDNLNINRKLQRKDRKVFRALYGKQNHVYWILKLPIPAFASFAYSLTEIILQVISVISLSDLSFQISHLLQGAGRRRYRWKIELLGEIFQCKID